MTRHFAWLIVLLFSAMPAAASDWSHWRGPWQTGVSPDTGLPTNVKDNVVWRKPLGGRSTPLVVGDKVYIINYDAKKEKVGGKIEDVPESIVERVMCLNADTGKVIWEKTFPVFHTDIVTSRLGWTNLAADPPTGYIYAHGTSGLFICYDGANGNIIWQHSLAEEYGRVTGYGGRITSPIVDEDLVILGMCNSSWGDQTRPANRYVAFDKRTGKIVWFTEATTFGGTYYSQPVIATINGQRLLIAGGSNGNVFALQVRTGKLAWSSNVSTSAINASPVVSGNYVYIGHGEESPDTNRQGRVACLDAGTIKDGEPQLVWKSDGIVARYSSPIIDGDKLYVAEENCTLFCLDAKKGKKLWKSDYGRSEQRGSPVLADGKIYVGEVAANFHILDANDKGKVLDTHAFLGVGGVNVELNGTPAVANGRVYFTTSEEIICIGTKKGVSAPNPPEKDIKVKIGKIAQLQIIPAEVALFPGGSTTFTVRGFDADGNFVETVKPDWTLPAPAPPPGVKASPPALKGEIDKAGKLTVDAKLISQQSIAVATFEGMTARARVRVAPKLPYAPDFSKLPLGVAPGGWVNAQGKYVTKMVNGKQVLAKVTDQFSPMISRGNAYITLPTAKDYTIQCDVQGNQKGNDLPEVGIGANRYTLMLAGKGKNFLVRLQSWDALPRVDKTIPFNWKPGTWYTLKLAPDVTNGKGVIRGKVWPRDEKEPKDWTVVLNDSNAIGEGSPTLYAYVTGNFNNQPGTDIYFDNLRITPNKVAGKKAADEQARAVTLNSTPTDCLFDEARPLVRLLRRR